MSSWIDTLLPASFAGINFQVESGSGGQCGRRHQLTNFPFSDRFSVDDMGRLNAPFTVRAFILDNDGDLHARHALLVAALNEGMNTLVHPRLGRMHVLPGNCSYTFQGARVKYTLQFLPPQDQAEATEIEETASVVDAAADKAIETVHDKASEQLDTHNRALLDDAVLQANDMLSALRDVNGRIDATIAPVSQLTHDIDQISDQMVDLIRKPAIFFNDMRDLYFGVLNAKTDINDALVSYRDLKFTPQVENNPTTPTQITRNTNRQVMASAMNSSLLFETVRLMALQSAELNVSSNDDSPFDSYQHAASVRDELVSELDQLIVSLDNQAFDAAVELRARFYRHIDAHGIRLPRVKTVTYGVPLPAWVIAHEVYGDVHLMGDVVRRNSIAQPVFIAAGTTLEILSNE